MSSVELRASFVGKAFRIASALGIVALLPVLDGCTSTPADEAKKAIEFKPADIGWQDSFETLAQYPTILRRLSDREVFTYLDKYSWEPNTTYLYNDWSLLPSKRVVRFMIDEKWEENTEYQGVALSARLILDSGQALNLYISSARIAPAKDVFGLNRDKYGENTVITMIVDTGYTIPPGIELNRKIWENRLEIVMQKVTQDPQLFEIEQVSGPGVPPETQTTL